MEGGEEAQSRRLGLGQVLEKFGGRGQSAVLTMILLRESPTIILSFFAVFCVSFVFNHIAISVNHSQRLNHYNSNPQNNDIKLIFTTWTGTLLLRIRGSAFRYFLCSAIARCHYARQGAGRAHAKGLE